MKNYILSKSTYVRAKQCTKSLYLNQFHPELRTAPDEQRLKIFQKGFDFEAAFKSKFPEGIDVKKNVSDHISSIPDETKKLLNSTDPITLFEAGFIYEDVLILIDVLHRDAKGAYHLYEVKANSELKDVFIWDMSLQYHVARHCLDLIEDFNIVLKVNPEGFNIINMKENLLAMGPIVSKEINLFKDVLLQDQMPEIWVGPQCSKPYKCDFYEHCASQAWE